MDLNLCQGQSLVFILVWGESFVSAVPWGSCLHVSRSSCPVWQEGKLPRRRQPLQFPCQDVISPGNLHRFSSTCPCRARQLAGETSIQPPSSGQRCTCLGAERIASGPSTPTTRSTATASKCSIRKRTPGWTPRRPRCFLKADGAIRRVSGGLLRQGGSGKGFLPPAGGVSGQRCGTARAARSLASVESCCQQQSLACSPACGGGVNQSR